MVRFRQAGLTLPSISAKHRGEMSESGRVICRWARGRNRGARGEMYRQMWINRHFDGINIESTPPGWLVSASLAGNAAIGRGDRQ
jgi:hypothetical protein